MPEKQPENLSSYDYVRRIAAENSHKPIGERFRLILNSPEHKRRRLLARTRASWMAIVGLCALAIFYLLILATGSPETPDSLQIAIIALIALIGGTAGWHIGTRRAHQKLASARRG